MTTEKFYNLQKLAIENYNNEIMKEFAKYGNQKDLLEIEDLALNTQIVIKKSKPNYNHGFLIFAALSHYLLTSRKEGQISCLDIGTARGFSALLMSLVLKKYNKPNSIITIDTVPHTEKRKWNCILDGKEGISRKEIVDRFTYSQNIIFMNGKSSEILKRLHMNRIEFAFVDGDHRWRSLKHEIEFIEGRQEKNDIILFDDFTPKNYPDVVKAVNKLAKKYHVKTFGNSERGYALLTKF